MKHDLFGTKRHGKRFTLLLISLAGFALVLLLVQIHLSIATIRGETFQLEAAARGLEW
jgi:hypothetical protein